MQSTATGGTHGTKFNNFQTEKNNIKHLLIFIKLGMNNVGPQTFKLTKFQQLSLDDLGSTPV